MEIKGSTLILETSAEVAAFAVLTGLAMPMVIIPQDNSLPKKIIYTHIDEAEDAAAGIREQLSRHQK